MTAPQVRAGRPLDAYQLAAALVEAVWHADEPEVSRLWLSLSPRMQFEVAVALAASHSPHRLSIAGLREQMPGVAWYGKGPVVSRGR